MNDPFKDINKMKELEALVSPIKPHKRRYTDFDIDLSSIHSDLSSDNENDISFESAIFQNKKKDISKKAIKIEDKKPIQSPEKQNTNADQYSSIKSTKQVKDGNDVEVVSLAPPTEKENIKCYFCHGTDDLVKCQGGCARSYHLRCIGGKAKKDMSTWKCRACSGKDLSSSAFHKKHCLRNWYFKEAVELPTNSFSIMIEGSLCSDGSMWRCSPIDHLLDSTHFVTINQSIYTLIGDMDVQKSIQNGFSEISCNTCKKGLPSNWRDEITSIAVPHSIALNEKSCIAPDFKRVSKVKRKRETEETIKPSPVTVIPLVQEETPSVRRSGRIRIPPLPFWKNEYLRVNEKTGTTELIMGSSNTALPKSVKRNVKKEELPENIKEEESFVQIKPIVEDSNEKDATFIQPSFEKTEDESFYQEKSSEPSSVVSESIIDNPFTSGMDWEQSSEDLLFEDEPKSNKPKKEKRKKISINLSEEEVALLREIADEETATTNKEAYEDMSRRLKKSVDECKEACRLYHIKIKKMKKEPAQYIPRLNQTLARKGTLKRKQQIRELLDVIETEDVEEKETKTFETKTLNSDWEAVFRMKTPSINRKKSAVMNASFLDTSMPLFEQLSDDEKDRVILSAEKIGKKKKSKPNIQSIMPAKKDVSKSTKGDVVGYLQHGVPVIEVHKKEADLDDLANSSFSDSLLDD